MDLKDHQSCLNSTLAMDPAPIDHSIYTKVGFEAYCSNIRIREIIIRQIYWEPVDMKYDPEF